MFKQSLGRVSLALSLLIILLAIQVPAQAQTNQPQRLPDLPSGYHLDPAVALVGTIVHAVWRYVPLNGDMSAIMYTTGAVRTDGINWQTPVAITPRNGATAPRIAVDTNGMYHIVWEDNDGIQYRSGDSPQRLGAGFSPDIAVAGDNTLHVTWSDLRNNAAPVLVRSRVNNQWTDEQVLATGGILTRRNRIAVTGTGLHIVAEYQVREQAALQTAYLHAGQFRHIHDEIGSIAGITPSIAADPQTGALVVGWVGPRNGGFALVTSRSTNGQQWSEPSYLQPNPNLWPADPSLAWVDNTPYAAYGLKDWDGERITRQRIFAGPLTNTTAIGDGSSITPALAIQGRRQIVLWSMEAGNDNVIMSHVTQLPGGFSVFLPLVVR